MVVLVTDSEGPPAIAGDQKALYKVLYRAIPRPVAHNLQNLFSRRRLRTLSLLTVPTAKPNVLMYWDVPLHITASGIFVYIFATYETKGE